MARRKKIVSPNEHLYSRKPYYAMPRDRVIERGEIIKIDGEWGGRFRFHDHVVRIDSGVEWIDCFEMVKGTPSAWRSFKADRIKLLPKKRVKKTKNV